MPTFADDLMEEVVARLRGYSPEIVDPDSIRRDHRTVVSREECPRIHVADGTETPKSAGRTACRCDVTLGFRVSIFVRDDAGYAAAGLLKIPIMAALDPATAYPHSARLTRGRITSDQEIADADSLRVDMEFEFAFQTAEWRLDA